MKPDDRVRALNVAAINLAWLTDKPHDRANTALRLLADVDARTAIAAGSRDDTGRRAVGGHSDPTAAAAGARVDAGASGRRIREAIRYDTVELTEWSTFLRSVVCGCDPHDAPPSLMRTLRNVEYCLTIPHSIAAWSSDDDETNREVDHAVDRMAQLSGILRTRVHRVLLAAARPAADKPTQKARECCESCARFGLDVDREYARLCRRCRDFIADHKVRPTEDICRRWHAGIGRITPGMIVEAKAAARVRGRKGA